MDFQIQLITAWIHLVQFFFLFHIPLPTRISKSSTLFNNILSNLTCLEEIDSHQCRINIFRPSPQFTFLADSLSKISAAKSNILRHDWRKFESNKFISDFYQTYWAKILCSEKSGANFSMNQYPSKMDSPLETHAPLKKLHKKIFKFFNKPWITHVFQNSIRKKNNIY